MKRSLKSREYVVKGLGGSVPHEEATAGDEHHRRGGKACAGTDETTQQGKGEVPDVAVLFTPPVKSDRDRPAHDTDPAIEGRFVVLRPAELAIRRRGQMRHRIPARRPGVSLEVGKRAQQDEVEDTDQGSCVEDDDLA